MLMILPRAEIDSPLNLRVQMRPCRYEILLERPIAPKIVRD